MIIKLNSQTGIIESKEFTKVDENIDIWMSGYFFFNNEFITANKISSWIKKVYCGKIENELVQKCNGAYKIVLIDKNEKSVICISDRFGTNPIYYYLTDTSLCLSEDSVLISRNNGLKKFNQSSVVELLETGYVTGNKTLIENVEEIGQSLICTFSWKDRIIKKRDVRYWRLTYTPDYTKSEEEWEKEAANLFDTVFSRYVSACNQNNWSTGFTLSGGIDSRLLLGMCGAKMGKATAISYGNQNDPDVVVAKEVASSLGIDLIQYEIDTDMFFSESVLRDIAYHVGVTSRLTVGTGIKTLALKYPNTEFDVLFAGHSFGLNAGSGIRPETISVKNEKQAKTTIINRHYASISKDVLKCILNISYIDPSEFVNETYTLMENNFFGSVERWNYENRQRRLILREMPIYEQLGKWFLPYYDYELFDFWSTVPMHLRLNKKMYVSCLKNNVFTKKLKSLDEIPLERGPLRSVKNTSFKDQFLLKSGDPRSYFPYWDFFTRISKLKKHFSKFKKSDRGPDAIEQWWVTNLELKNRIISTIRNSEYLASCLDIAELLKILNKRFVPNMLLRTGIPSILAIHFVGECLDNSKDESKRNAREV